MEPNEVVLPNLLRLIIQVEVRFQLEFAFSRESLELNVLYSVHEIRRCYELSSPLLLPRRLKAVAMVN